MALNVKAQASRLFAGLKETPIAKGIGDVLYVEDLFKNAKTKSVHDISTKAKNSLGLLRSHSQGMHQDSIKIAEDNVKFVENIGMSGIKDEALRDYISSNNKDINGAFEDAVVNFAKHKAYTRPAQKLSSSEASSLITESAKAVDGQVSLMTPINAAMEYYGTPISGAINSISNQDYMSAIKSAGIGAARIGVTGAATFGGAALVTGTVNGVRTGIDRMRGNYNER